MEFPGDGGAGDLFRIITVDICDNTADGLIHVFEEFFLILVIQKTGIFDEQLET